MSRKQTSDESSVPDFLVVAIDQRHLSAITEWWNNLSDEQQHDLLDDATNQPNNIAAQTDLDHSLDDDEPNEWYEYVVNQDMRFYFDRHNGHPCAHGYIVYPMISAISIAADAHIVSHVLKRTDS